jgi:GTP pyrophosphokinase
MNRYKEETLKYLVPIAENTDEKMVLKLSVALYELK